MKVFLKAKIQYTYCKGESKSRHAHPPQPDITTADDWVCACVHMSDVLGVVTRTVKEPYEPTSQSHPELSASKGWRILLNIERLECWSLQPPRLRCLLPSGHTGTCHSPRGSRAERLLFTVTWSKVGFNTWIYMHTSYGFKILNFPMELSLICNYYHFYKQSS